MFLCSLSIGINMHFIDIFLIGIILVLIAPLIGIIFVLDKKGENILFCFLWPLCWWLTKRGRSIWVYMHVLYASRNIVCFLLVCFLLISRALLIWALLIFGIKSVISRICFWYQEPYLCFIFGINVLFQEHCFMHVYAFSCLIFIAYIYCLLLCMS